MLVCAVAPNNKDRIWKHLTCMHECQPDLTLTCIKYCHANSALRVADVLNSSASLTWKRKASPTELLRQKTKSFLGCSGTAWTMLFSTHSACLWTLLWSIPERPSYSYRKRVQPWRTHKKKGVKKKRQKYVFFVLFCFFTEVIISTLKSI